MKDPRRPLLIGGLCLLGAGGTLYFVDALAAARPWLLLAGALMTALYFVLARLVKAPAKRDAESMLYGDGDTAMDDLPPRRDDK